MISTIELDRLMTKLLSTYKGAFAIDQLPANVLSRPSCFISNTDVAALPGSHWMAICLPPEKHLLYFIDPYDLPLHKMLPHLRKWLKQHPFQIITLPYAIQPLHSTLCGAYCAFILYHLPLFNYNLNKVILYYFNHYDLGQNESIVASWWCKNKLINV